MSMENNSEIIAPSIVDTTFYCSYCDLEFGHDGACDSEDEDYEGESRYEFPEDDVWADANALSSSGHGDDEDYGSGYSVVDEY